MEVKELDVVKLKDGREGTVLEVFEKGKAFMIEIADDKGYTIDTPIIQIDEIEKITYVA